MLGARRDGSATAETSRGLLTSLLGEFVLPTGGGVWTQTLIEAMALLGVQDKATRQAITRMRDRGWLVGDRTGRRTRWCLTETSTELLEAGAARIYGFGRSPLGWSGRWLLVLASVPEAERNVRYRLGVGLSWAGFGSLGQGVWITPWPEREPAAVRVLADLGIVGATTFTARLGSLGVGPELATRAWDLPAVRSQYEDFLREAALPTHRGADGEAGAVAARALTMLVHRWRRFPFLDPELPSELLPPDWPGPAAATAFANRRAALLEPARRWWSSTEGHFGDAVPTDETEGGEAIDARRVQRE